MKPLTPARRFSLIIAAVTGGVIVAMIVQIMLARRGVEFTGALSGLLRGGGVRLHAALAWWAVTGAAFLASFIIAAVISHEIWRALGSLRTFVTIPVVLALASIAALAPLSAPGAAAPHAIATLTAMLAALLMAWFGAFFAVRR